MPMLEPPPLRGFFSREQLTDAAASLLRRSSHPDDSPESGYLTKGGLTLITDFSNTARSRFIVGLIHGMMDSSRLHKVPRILYFSRRWTHQEATKALIQQAAKSSLGGDTAEYRDALITAIGHIRLSGFVYDNTVRTMDEICRRVCDEAQSAKLIVVDGLEHFSPETIDENLLSPLPEMLHQLKALAKETMLPIIVSAPPWTIESKFGDLGLCVKV
jgi:replicative DNA helicase